MCIYCAIKDIFAPWMNFLLTQYLHTPFAVAQTNLTNKANRAWKGMDFVSERGAYLSEADSQKCT